MYMHTLIKINKKQRANEQILIRERAASEPNRGRVDDVCRAGQPAQIVKLLPPDEFHQRGARALYTCMISHGAGTDRHRDGRNTRTECAKSGSKECDPRRPCFRT